MSGNCAAIALTVSNLDLKSFLAASATNLRSLAEGPEFAEHIQLAARMLLESFKKGGCLYIAGNGGSAADAQHLAAELVGRFEKERPPIKALALNTDSSAVTAIANDYSFADIFSRPLEAFIGKEDVFLGISTSGSSPNILNALRVCRKKGARSILLGGRQGGEAKALADLCILVPGATTREIQECHTVVYHALCALIDDQVHGS